MPWAEKALLWYEQTVWILRETPAFFAWQAHNVSVYEGRRFCERPIFRFQMGSVMHEINFHWFTKFVEAYLRFIPSYYVAYYWDEYFKVPESSLSFNSCLWILDREQCPLWQLAKQRHQLAVRTEHVRLAAAATREVAVRWRAHPGNNLYLSHMSRLFFTMNLKQCLGSPLSPQSPVKVLVLQLISTHNQL